MAAKKNKMPEENFFDALEMLSRERGIPVEELTARIGKAIESAVKKDYDVDEEHIRVVMDTQQRRFAVSVLKDVVDAIPEPAAPEEEPAAPEEEPAAPEEEPAAPEEPAAEETAADAAAPDAQPEGEEGEAPEAPARPTAAQVRHMILLQDALKIDKNAAVGGQVEIFLKTKEFGRIAAQTAKHVIRQGLRDAERNIMYTELQSKSHEILPAIVTGVDEKRGLVALAIGRHEAVLPRSEQVPGEVLLEGQRVKVYVVEVLPTDRGPKVMLSRTHPGLVKRIFEMEVPEIFDGTVEIRAISREAGQRTKMAVWSRDPNVDAVGACIGPRGARVNSIVEELGGEKIDIVRYSEDPAEFIAAAIAPANALKVEILDAERKSCRVTVPDHQLSLAIGNKGLNARLTARLTGYNVDIRPESGYYGEDPQP